MNRVLEHVVNEVRVRFDEVVQGLQDLQVLTLLLMVDIKTILILVKFHLVHGLLQFTTLFFHHFLPLLDLLFLFLELLDLAVDLLLHHLE